MNIRKEMNNMTDKDCISLCNSVNSLLTDKKPAVQFSSGILQTESEIYDDEHGCEYLSSLTEKKYESWIMLTAFCAMFP